jgi:hypothetical protein
VCYTLFYADEIYGWLSGYGWARGDFSSRKEKEEMKYAFFLFIR